MARVSLALIGWEYETDTAELHAIFTEASDPGSSDPARFDPSMQFRVELTPGRTMRLGREGATWRGQWEEVRRPGVVVQDPNQLPLPLPDAPIPTVKRAR